MTDELDHLLAASLAARAEHAPGGSGFTDVRRRVRRHRHRKTALTMLPALVGAGAVAAWMRHDDGRRLGADGSTETTTTSALSTTVPTPATGFRCSAAGLTADEADGWLSFQACEPWSLDGRSPTISGSTTTTLPVLTPWDGPSTEDVVFLNASQIGGVAPIVAGVHFGAGQSAVSPISSETSFVMYAGQADASFASQIAASLGVPARIGVDERYLPDDAQPPPSIAVVVGEDLAALLNSAPSDPVDPPVRPLTGAAMRCWGPSEAAAEEEGYRYFVTCEPVSPPSGDSSTTITADTTVTNPLLESSCLPGQYFVDESDSRQIVAQQFDLTVAELDAANVATVGYDTFSPGLVIVIPCGAGE